MIQSHTSLDKFKINLTNSGERKTNTAAIILLKNFSLIFFILSSLDENTACEKSKIPKATNNSGTAILIHFIISLINLGLGEGFVANWFKAWGIAFVCAFPIIVIVAPIVHKIVHKLIVKI